MKLTVVNSGSSGNCYLVHNETETLIIELGVRFSEIKKAIKFNLKKVAGCLVTHSHQDHCKGVADAVKAGLDVYMLKTTAEETGVQSHRINHIEKNKVFMVGGFRIIPFPLLHDVASVGFFIDHPETGRFCFITDTKYTEYTFPKLSNIIVEANYCEDILQERVSAGDEHAFLGKRIVNSHMSLQTCIGFLKANDLSNVSNIVLIHLSGRNSDPVAFKEKVARETMCNVEIATKGLEMNFNKTLF